MKYELPESTVRANRRALIVVLILIFVPLTIFIVYQTIMYANPYLRINFITYVPSNKQITGQELYLSTYKIPLTRNIVIDTYIHPDVEVDYKLKGSGINVTQVKAKGAISPCKKDVVDAISHSHCAMGRTPQGRSYYYDSYEQLSDGIYDGDEGVTVDLNGTRIHLNLVVHSPDQLGKTDWGALIDSLQPIKFNSSNLPVYRRQSNFTG